MRNGRTSTMTGFWFTIFHIFYLVLLQIWTVFGFSTARIAPDYLLIGFTWGGLGFILGRVIRKTKLKPYNYETPTQNSKKKNERKVTQWHLQN